jgi:hypothetical protein
MKLFLPMLLFYLPQAFGSTDLSYSSSQTKFSLRFDENEIFITDQQFGPRSLSLKACNKAAAKKFTESLTNHFEHLQLQKRISGVYPKRSAHLRFENIDYAVLSFEPGFRFFNQIPMKANLLFIQSDRQCAK